MVIYENSFIIFTWSIINIQSADYDWQLWFYASNSTQGKSHLLNDVCWAEFNVQAQFMQCTVQDILYDYWCLKLSSSSFKLKKHCFMILLLIELISWKYSGYRKCHMISRLITHKESKKHSWIVYSDQWWVSRVIRATVRPTHLMSLRGSCCLFRRSRAIKKQRRQRWSAKLMSPELLDHSVFNETHTMPILKTLQMTPCFQCINKVCI